MGTRKDRNGMDLTEAEDIKKRWQEYTEELFKTDLHDPDNHDDVITHLEPDILECKVKWVLGNITTNKLVEVIEFQWSLLLGGKVMANLNSILKSRDITLPSEVRLVKAMGFPVIMCGYESWTIKKAEHQRIDAFDL